MTIRERIVNLLLIYNRYSVATFFPFQYRFLQFKFLFYYVVPNIYDSPSGGRSDSNPMGALLTRHIKITDVISGSGSGGRGTCRKDILQRLSS